MRFANGMFRNETLDDLQEKHCYEIVTWPMHYSDELCMQLLRTNTDYQVITYIALMGGITPIITIGSHKAFIADFSKKKQKSKFKQLQPKSLNPSYSNREKVEKHLRDQRGSR